MSLMSPVSQAMKCETTWHSGAQSRSVLFLDCTHPDEWNTGIAARTFTEAPINGVHVVMANAMTHLRNRQTGERKRYTDSMLNMQPEEIDEETAKTDYEAGNTLELASIAGLYDIAIETHGTEEDEPWAMYHPNASYFVRAIAATCANVAIIAGANSLAGRRRNVLSFDIPAKWGADAYRDRMRKLALCLASGWLPSAVRLEDMVELEYLKTVTAAQVEEHKLPDYIAPFSRLSNSITAKLDLPSDSRALFWDKEKYGARTGYVAEIARPYLGSTSMQGAYTTGDTTTHWGRMPINIAR